jgi:hypothetical protein
VNGRASLAPLRHPRPFPIPFPDLSVRPFTGSRMATRGRSALTLIHHAASPAITICPLFLPHPSQPDTRRSYPSQWRSGLEIRFRPSGPTDPGDAGFGPSLSKASRWVLVSGRGGAANRLGRRTYEDEGRGEGMSPVSAARNGQPRKSALMRQMMRAIRQITMKQQMRGMRRIAMLLLQ